MGKTKRRSKDLLQDNFVEVFLGEPRALVNSCGDHKQVLSLNKGENVAYKAKNMLADELTRLGATQIKVQYSGQGDDGEIQQVEIFCGSKRLDLPGHTLSMVKELLWNFAESRHPGFENGYGACGKITGVAEPTWSFVNEHYPYDEEDDEMTDD